MKTTFYKLIPALLFLISFSGCKGNAPENPTDLTGTSWKLAGIYDVQSETLTVLEPIDCDDCYTLTFETDNTFSTFSSVNNLGGGYVADYETNSFQIIDFGGTKINEVGDGKLYDEPFWSKAITVFSLNENELRLYYSGNNYLLFNLKNQ